MAAFSYYLDSDIFLPNIAPSIMIDDGSFNSNCFSQIYPPELSHESLLEFDPNRLESSCVVDHCSNSKIVSQSDKEPSVGKKQSTGCGDSIVVDKLENGEQVTQNVSLGNSKKRTRTFNSAKKSKDAKIVIKKEKKKCNNNAVKIEKKTADQEPKTGYIHVRARRGQATDTHSLAERARRKKISERMKMLQCLVPGCEKVTGKALMLDEIINYVQFLQNQVEFLSMSMKLATVNPMFYDFGVDLGGFMVKLPARGVNNNSEASTPCMQQSSSPTEEGSVFVESTTNFAPSNYPLLDLDIASSSSPALLLHHPQTPFLFSSHPQDNGSTVLWDVEDQRQKFLINSSSGLNDNLCSFH